MRNAGERTPINQLSPHERWELRLVETLSLFFVLTMTITLIVDQAGVLVRCELHCDQRRG